MTTQASSAKATSETEAGTTWVLRKTLRQRRMRRAASTLARHQRRRQRRRLLRGSFALVHQIHLLVKQRDEGVLDVGRLSAGDFRRHQRHRRSDGCTPATLKRNDLKSLLAIPNLFSSNSRSFSFSSSMNAWPKNEQPKPRKELDTPEIKMESNRFQRTINNNFKNYFF